MTDEEKAVSILERMAIDMTECLAETEEPMADVLAQRLAAINLAQDALRDRIAREKPVALTLEELRGMDGEPVWCEYINLRGEHRGGKRCICRTIYGDIQPMDGYAEGGTDTSTICYGKTWLAYRTKPKERTT